MVPVLRLGEDSNVDRTPGRLVVSALISLYLAFGCALGSLALSSLSPLGTLLGAFGGIFGFVWLPLIVVAIFMRLADRQSGRKTSS